MPTSVIYPGTFDPITLGHVDLILRASKIFPNVIVAISEDTAKHTLFSADERISFAKDALKSFENVEVVGFKGLLADFAKSQNVTTIVRGIRAIADFEYERQLASTNRHLNKNMDTIFLAPNEKYAHISSTFVRDIIRLGGDVSQFVPAIVAERIKKHGVNDHG